MSIVDVAKRAGVSLATVSRVMNRKPGVSPQIRQVVREAMKQLEYTPPAPEHRPGPRARVSKKSNAGARVDGTLAVVMLDELYQYSPGLFLLTLRGVQREAADHGWRTVTAFLQDDQQVPTILRSGIDAAVAIGATARPKALAWLQKIPHVWLTSHRDSSGTSAMEGNHEIARMACDRLIDRGHKHLAFVAVTSSYPAFQARAKSMQFFAANRGATVALLVDKDNAEQHPLPDFDELQRRMDLIIGQLVVTSPRPTGVFVGNDAMAAMVYRSLRRRKLTPGKDVEVVSCNNDKAMLMGLEPRPATIDLGTELLARRSIEQLLRSVRKPEESRRVRIAISPQLIANEA